MPHSHREDKSTDLDSISGNHANYVNAGPPRQRRWPERIESHHMGPDTSYPLVHLTVDHRGYKWTNDFNRPISPTFTDNYLHDTDGISIYDDAGLNSAFEWVNSQPPSKHMR